MAMDAQTILPTAAPVSEPVETCDSNLNDPPPPYPARERRSRMTRRLRLTGTPRIQTMPAQEASQVPLPSEPRSDETEEGHYYDHLSPHAAGATETTSLLAPSSPSISPITVATAARRRRQSLSHGSVVSAAPSLGQTVLSLFHTTDDEHDDEDTQPLQPSHAQVNSLRDGEAGTDDDLQSNQSPEQHRLLDSSRDITRGGYGCEWTAPGSIPAQQQLGRTKKGGFFSLASWRRYFRPLVRMAYYRALFHLLVLNFPYALVAWIYLFIFTLTGTTLLMALPLGAVLCFLNLLGARTFSRGELALQSRFHSPLAYPLPYPPRPIFTRFRSPTASEVELGLAPMAEPSFYKNTYAMFTDPTSYQALFYFIVVKPSITIILSFFLLVFVVPAMILILPAPAALRAVRKLGAWQANVAIEGLYLAVR